MKIKQVSYSLNELESMVRSGEMVKTLEKSTYLREIASLAGRTLLSGLTIGGMAYLTSEFFFSVLRSSPRFASMGSTEGASLEAALLFGPVGILSGLFFGAVDFYENSIRDIKDGRFVYTSKKDKRIRLHLPADYKRELNPNEKITFELGRRVNWEALYTLGNLEI